MNDANSVDQASRSLWFRLGTMAAVISLFLGSGALWWRFGESVYLTSMVNMIIACF